MEAPRLRVAAALAGLLAASATAQSPSPTWQVPHQARHVEIDGVLDEWDGVPALELQRAEQVAHVRGAPWRGVNDLSATIHVSHDAAHLYIAGRIRDDELVREREGGDWYRGDAVEVFLDTDLGDAGEEGDGSRRFDRDEVQLFLMPLNPVRQWGVVTYEPDPQPGGSHWTGVRVAHVETEGKGYDFEAVVPLHNLPALQPGTPEIGFNVAIDDYDGESRYVYMSWTGTLPVNDTAQLVPVELLGPAVLEPEEGGGSRLYEPLRDALPLLVALVALMALGFVLLRGWSWLSRQPPRLRIGVQVAAALLLASGLFLPEWLQRVRALRNQAELGDAVRAVESRLPLMEAGTLGSYRGGERDRAFLRLVRGESVPRKTSVTHEALSDLAEGGFGGAPRRYPAEGFPIRPYWIPLRPEQSEQLRFDGSPGRELIVVLSLPAAREEPSSAPIRLSMHPRAGGPPLETVVDLEERPKTPGMFFGRPETDMAFVRMPVEEPITGLELQPLAVGGMSLVGVTAVTDEGSGRALTLGQASLGGVETDLRGAYPRDAGIRLGPGSVHRVRLDPDRARRFEKVWLFYQADYPGTDRPLPFVGEKISEVVLHFRQDEPAPLTVELHHQESVFFERAGNNQDAEPRHPRASVAFRWEGEGREQHVTLGYEVDLPADGVVEAIEFRNLQRSYPIRFRSVVFRHSVPTVRTEPPGSPLRVTASGREVVLDAATRSELEGAGFAIYRSGHLQQAIRADAAATLPSGMEESSDSVRRRVADAADGRSFEAYVPLAGDGWSGAVLGVFVVDEGWTDHVRWLHRLGFVLCLLAAPLLLLVFGESVAVLSSLRLRLMVVLTVAALLPLGLLSLVLVKVLESGHERRLQEGMLQAIASATDRLDEHEEELVASTGQWLSALVAELERSGAGALADDERRAELERRLHGIMAAQKPPDWPGGFSRLEFSSHDLDTTVTVFVGGTELQTAETPLRNEPAVYVSWGVPFLGVRLERELPALGKCSLSVGRPLDRGLLGGLSPGRGVVLCDARGYALDAVEGRELAEDVLLRSGRQPRLMVARRQAVARVLDDGQPVFVRHRQAGSPWIAGYDVLRDLDETPRALLGLVEPDQDATLPLRMGAVPVRTFFVGVGGLLLLFSVLLSFVVTARISRPIERLERGAQALGGGELDVRVDVDEGGQIGRLTRAFNHMAEELRGRILDLHHLNRGIQDLGARLDVDETAASATAFCAQHSPADRVCLLLRDSERGRITAYGSGEGELDPEAPDVAVVTGARGPFTLRLGDGALARRFPGCGSAVVLPLLLAGRNRGALLLLFERARPDPVNLELLATMAAQTAAALENARLYRYAVEDPHTGAFLPDFFRRRLADEVQRARERDEPLALLALTVTDGERLEDAIGAEQLARIMERVTHLLRRALPAGAMLCRAGEDVLQVALPGADRDAAEAVAADAVSRLEEVELGLPEGAPPVHLQSMSVVYPQEAASAEFMIDALDFRRATSKDERPRVLAAEGLVFTSAPMQDVLRTLERVAPTELTVLLEGETGTGKEVLIDLVHAWSKRRDGPLIKVHCAALSESLLQSELFGHEKGAFTGAVARKIGKFELAQGGTLFLDEIGEISLDTQVKLLRVLQEREIDRVGGVHPIPVDVRVLAATNRNMRALVAEGRFREDLYYRLQGMVVTVPPLRERKTEIPELVEHFRREAEASGQTKVRGFHPDAMDVLFRHEWPGNVRELRNTVLRALVLAPGEQVRREDLLAVMPGTSSVRTSLVGREPQVQLPRAPVAWPPAEAAPRTPPLPRLEGRLGRLVELLRERGSLSTPEYVELVGVSHRTGLRDLTELVRLGIAERRGKRRGARYRLARTRLRL